MSGWTAKRFWKDALVDPVEGGFAVRLDGRPLRTPAKTPMVVPTVAMATAIAAEWDAQGSVVNPLTMPVTRSANAALDKVAVQLDEVSALIAAYGSSDLLCYRATGPDLLVNRLATGWDPLIDWAATALQAPLLVTKGVVPIPQPDASISRLAALVSGFGAFELTALHDLVAITGSLVLGLAVTEGRLDAEAAWTLSRIDETWQADLWGRDEDADAMETQRRNGLLHAGRFFQLCHHPASGSTAV